MVKTAYIKNCIRKIKETRSRYISILLIVLLGTAFFVGMNSVSPDMKQTAQKYLKDNNSYDIQLLSNLGFTKEDVEAIKNYKNIKEVKPSYTVDVIVKENDKDLTIRTTAIEENTQMNQFQIVEGKMPETPVQCAIDERFTLELDYTIGDKIRVYDGKGEKPEEFKIQEFEIVGLVRTPRIITHFNGTTNVGTGELMGNLFFKEEIYDMNVYTNIYLSTYTEQSDKFSKEYQEEIEKIVKQIEKDCKEREQLRYSEIYNEIEEEINKGKREVADAKEQLRDAQNKITEAKLELKKAKKKVYKSSSEFITTVESVSSELENAKNQLKVGKEEITKNESTLQNMENEIWAKEMQLAKQKTAKEQYEQICGQLDGKIIELNSLLSQIPNTDPSYKEVQRKIEELETDYSYYKNLLNEENTKILENTIEMTYKQAIIEEGKKQINTAKANITLGNDVLNKQSNVFQNTQISTSKTIDSYANDIKNNLKKIRESEEEFEEKKQDAEKEIADAQKDIADAEKTLNDLNGKWYVIAMHRSIGFSALERDLDKIGILGKVFPVIFFFVAGLVSVTATTRMIEEDRNNIGILKALGYKNKAIIGKYLFYALSATIIGTAVGTLLGNFIISNMVYESYRILYILPDLLTNFQWSYVFIATLSMIAFTVILSILVCVKELKEQPSELFRPKAPKIGKTILLERMPRVWKLLSFNFKISFRNIFRYKRRLIMALIGIAGCTALIYTGLSIKTSVDKIAVKQYGKIKAFDAELTLKHGYDEESIKELLKNVKENDLIESAMPVRQNALTLDTKEKEMEVFYVAGDMKELNQYIALQDRKTQNKITSDKNGIIISEKLTKKLNVKLGDTIYVKKENDEKVKFTIQGVTENYLYDYAYISNNVYEEIYKEPMEYNQIFINSKEEANEKELVKQLREMDEISAVILTSEKNMIYQDSLASVQSVVFILIGSAAILFFVVLFNLNSINLEERRREFATMKVLGFHNKQISNYMRRENMIMSILGVVFGLIIGIFMLQAILQSVEVETIFIARELNILNFILAFAITIIFTLITSFLTQRSTKKINMIESLKSVE